MRPTRAASALLLVGGFLAVLMLRADAAGSGDPAKDIKDKDVKVRIEAVEALSAGGANAEALLLEALKDKDWQVVEKAADALGRAGSKACLDELVTLATQGPIRRIRITAARSAGKVDATAALESLGKKINGDAAVRALEAIAAITAGAPNDAAGKAVDEAIKPSKRHELDRVSGAFKDRDPVRKAAAAAITAFPTAGRVARVEKLMFDQEIGVACAALDTVVAEPDPAFLPVLLNGLGAQKIDDCVERRIRWAIRAIVAADPASADSATVGAAASKLLAAVGTAVNPDNAARLTRVIGELAKAPPAVDPDLPAAELEKAKSLKAILAPDKAVEALQPAVNHADAKVRAAAAAAMGKIGTELAIAHDISLATQDKDAHVRVMALRALAATLTAKDAKAFKVFVDLLGDSDPLVREEAAVALGVKGVQGAIPALAKVADEAIADKVGKERKSGKWALGTAALVSMGKTQDDAAVEPLRKAYKDATDWRLKASAVVGMGRVQKPGSVPDLIDALDDAKDPSVHTTAFEFLRRLTSNEIPDDSKSWREWWKINEKNYQFIDREADYRKARKYGYAPTIEGLYQGLDVIVLATRGGGDRIEDLLDTMKIVHRLCRAPQVTEANLHPYALFIANCPGEIVDKDVEAISWFVRSGGYLFSSCWSLHEVIEKVYPGIVKRFDTPGAQVIDYNVTAAPCVPDALYLEGVFDPWTRPMYVLEGAHLVEVIDRDRVETLIDSPDSATSWGSGNLACWFTAGHGVILDSVNHFNHQGFHFASGLKTAEDRAAYAMDHMGLTYSDLREFMAKKTFDNSGRCAKEVTDESAFRFISNFVRAKRRVDL